MTPLGQKVKELRIAQGLTQLGLAERSALSHSLVTALETGRRSYVTARDVEQLAVGLAVAEEDLWGLIPGGKTDKRYIKLST